VTRGLLDASVVIDWDDPSVASALPEEVAVSTITLAELSAGPHLATSPVEAARRQARLQQIEGLFESVPFDGAAARSFGQVVAAAAERGRTRRRRVADLLIAATAHANRLTLYTRNPDDFGDIGGLIEVIGL
jgi:predicted nucleic acid-binding protein